MRFARWSAAALLVPVVAVGCTAGPSDKSGGSGGVRTLALASPESPGRPGSLDVEYFAEQVESRSDGRLRIEVTWEVGFDQPSWDQVTAHQVIDGTVELGFVPARSWDVLGVTTMQALQAPFVITSDAALDAVVADPVATDMLAGLAELGVTGLGLFPEGLRHPASFGEPLLEPADFAGTGIRTPRSELSWSIMRALGAEPLDVSGAEEGALFDSGDLGAAETSAAYLPSLPRPGVMTANVTLYPKANALVANTAALAELSEDERAVLSDAAEVSLAHSIGARRSDAQEVATLCQQGLPVAFASPVHLAALALATRPVHDGLAGDPVTGPLLARVTEIVEEADPPDPMASCEDAAFPAVPSAVDTGAYDGVWRFEVPYQDGLDAGLPADRAGAELGLQTVRLNGGTFRWDWRSERGEQSCEGTYTIADGVLTFREERPCGAVWDARPQRIGEEIVWTDVRTRAEDDQLDQTLRELLHSVPWQKIEDVPPVDVPPDGVYRWAVDEADLLAAGTDGGTAYHNSGLMTMTLEGGRWLHQTDSAADPPDCGGRYAVRGARVVFTADDVPECGGAALVFAGRWDPTDDGIAFTDIQPASPFSDIMWGTPWRRIS